MKLVRSATSKAANRRQFEPCEPQLRILEHAGTRASTRGHVAEHRPARDECDREYRKKKDKMSLIRPIACRGHKLKTRREQAVAPVGCDQQTLASERGLKSNIYRTTILAIAAIDRAA